MSQQASAPRSVKRAAVLASLINAAYMAVMYAAMVSYASDDPMLMYAFLLLFGVLPLILMAAGSLLLRDKALAAATALAAMNIAVMLQLRSLIVAAATGAMVGVVLTYAHAQLKKLGKINEQNIDALRDIAPDVCIAQLARELPGSIALTSTVFAIFAAVLVLPMGMLGAVSYVAVMAVATLIVSARMRRRIRLENGRNEIESVLLARSRLAAAATIAAAIASLILLPFNDLAAVVAAWLAGTTALYSKAAYGIYAACSEGGEKEEDAG